MRRNFYCFAFATVMAGGCATKNIQAIASPFANEEIASANALPAPKFPAKPINQIVTKPGRGIASVTGATYRMRVFPEFKGNQFTLTPGQNLISQNGQYYLTLQTDGNVVIYNIFHPVFATNTVGRGATKLVFQGDGNLVLYAGSAAVWASNTQGNATAKLVLQDDGNLVIYSATGKALWSAGESSGVATSGAVNAIVTGSLANTKVVTTNFPTSDVVISDYDAVAEYGADPTGNADSTFSIQQALNDCSAHGGGTVWLQGGSYRVFSTIQIPAFCSLRGDWHPFNGNSKGETIINAHLATADSTGAGPAVFSVGGSSTLMGVVIYYPDQNLNAVTPFGYSIVIPSGGVNYMSSSIINVTLLNAYKGISISPDWTTAHEVATVQNVEGTVLSNGIFSTNSADVDVYENISFGPQYWSSAGPSFSAPPVASLASYTRKNATAYLFGDLEWSQFLNISATSFNIGIHTVLGKRIHFIGEFAGSNITDCATGIQIDDVDTRFIKGVVFTGGTVAGLNYGVKNTSGGLITLIHMSVKGASLGKVVITNQPAGGQSSAAIPPIFTEPTISDIPKTDSVDLYNAVDAPFYAVRVLPNQNGLIPFYDLDSTKSIQAALTEAGNQGGGVVYLPAGWYFLSGRLSVPANVELRGASTGPVRTQGGLSGGTVLFTTVGENSRTAATDAAFITLNGAGAGVSGLVIFYPDNNPGYSLHETYPYAIRGSGEGTYIKNIGLSNGVYGIDLATNNNQGHFVERVVGLANYNFIKAGNGSGLLRNILSNPNSGFRNGFGLQRWPAEGSATMTNLINTNRGRLNLINLQDSNTEPEQLANIFAYGASYGVVNQRANVNVYNLGTDNLGSGYTIWTTEPISVENVLRYSGQGSTYGVAPSGGILLWNDDYIQ